ncbi:universal stress protein [Spirosoma foliorum]|uniref:Universal stress protein n=1 Tax=Spirosoma foliorum TaxID=2710596 RepID=A0A7G5GRN8_9BACT|nr:universal stress protein [Spirosoma foliorum]QMW01530.1 universal stress protein [Spirosoma foliorum]
MQTSPIKKLLVPIDYSQTALNALDLAVAMAQRHNAEIRLAHVAKSNSDDYLWEDGDLLDGFSKSPSEKEILRLRQLAETISTTHSISCSFDCKTGIVCDKIVEAAAEFSADLIVIGTHGTSGLRSYFMGLEAYRVVKAAACPVLTVPNHQKWTSFREIIFPVRPIPGTIDKYDLARTISLKNNAHLTVLGLLDRHDELKNEILTSVLATLNNRLTLDKINGDMLLVETDSVPYTIRQKASELQADLIVITSDIHTASKFSLFGPFVEQIVNHAKVPVLAIKPQPIAGTLQQPADGLFQAITSAFSPA